MAKKKIKHGFTLVEVLVAVIIISILTGISTMAYFGLQAQGRDKTRQANASIIAEQLEKYYDKHGEYPSVPSLVGQPGSIVKDKLKLSNPDVLVLPQAPAGTTNSFTQSESSPTQLAYNGQSVDSEEGTCENDINGGCDQFNLQWENESGDSFEIPSRHSSRSTAGETVPPPSAPDAPGISGEFNGANAVATLTPVSCDAGATPEYKIASASSTTSADPTFPDWSTMTWQTGLTKSVPATEGTRYFFVAIAHCVNSGGPSENSDESEVVELYYATAGAPVVNATISGTAVSVSVVPTTCPSGSTAKYQIREKQDTTTTAGTMTIIPTRDFTTASTYTTTAGPASSPTRHTFRAYTRCDVGTAQGATSPASADSVVVSAPAAPTLSKNTTATSGSANSITWSWTAGSACPVGTSVMFNRIWTGDYTNEGSGGNTTATSIALTTSSQGYQYGMKVRASCGAAVANKVLLSPYSSDLRYVRDVDSEIWAYKGSIRTRRPDPSGHPNTVFAQTIVHTSRNVAYNGGYNSPTPNQGYPASGNCASGLTRKIQWQWALDNIGGNSFGYNDTSGAVNNGAYSPEYTWADGTSKVFPSASTISGFTNEGMRDLDKNPNYTTTDGSNSKVEFAFRTRCINTSTGRSGSFNRADPFGNMTALEHNGKFHTFCEADGAVPWCKAWHSGRNPLSDHVGEWAGHDAGTGTCRGGGYPDDRFCFSPMYNSNSAPWGW